jgi:sterol desaturase/sphingolipid hydroxylase (fatty acid hydroxylase superfamily)
LAPAKRFHVGHDSREEPTMESSAPFVSSFITIAAISLAMAGVAAIELAIPLHARGRWNRLHLTPNLALTFLTFGTNLFLNVALVVTVAWLDSVRFGVLHLLSLSPLVSALVAVAALDFSFYAAHVSWHKFRSLWRFHSVHHSDPAVDVTTTIRQHPVESFLRYGAMGAMVVLIGPSPAAFALYRVASALNGLLEHSNVRAPHWLDSALSLITTWPYMHKVHHSRAPEKTDTNYGNLFSLWDRLFGTFTPSREGTSVVYGLDGFDDPTLQTTKELLALPFRSARAGGDSAPTLANRLA